MCTMRNSPIQHSMCVCVRFLFPNPDWADMWTCFYTIYFFLMTFFFLCIESIRKRVILDNVPTLLISLKLVPAFYFFLVFTFFSQHKFLSSFFFFFCYLFFSRFRSHLKANRMEFTLKQQNFIINMNLTTFTWQIHFSSTHKHVQCVKKILRRDQAGKIYRSTCAHQTSFVIETVKWLFHFTRMKPFEIIKSDQMKCCISVTWSGNSVNFFIWYWWRRWSNWRLWYLWKMLPEFEREKKIFAKVSLHSFFFARKSSILL